MVSLHLISPLYCNFTKEPDRNIYSQPFNIGYMELLPTLLLLLFFDLSLK